VGGLSRSDPQREREEPAEEETGRAIQSISSSCGGPHLCSDYRIQEAPYSIETLATNLEMNICQCNKRIYETSGNLYQYLRSLSSVQHNIGTSFVTDLHRFVTGVEFPI
jgi:hypothetical protein